MRASNTTPPLQALFALRCGLAALLFVHGVARIAADAVAPFGSFLDSAGLPSGIGLAWGVTLLEVVGAPLLAWGRAVAPLCLVFSAVYACGIALVHVPNGWFVVGLGRNGMEYSVLVILCLLALAWAQRSHPTTTNVTRSPP